MFEKTHNAVLLYILSLSGLFLLFFLQGLNLSVLFDEKKNWIDAVNANGMSLFFLVLLFVCFLIYRSFSNYLKNNTGRATKLQTCSNESFEQLGFFATYIVPLISFDITKSDGLVSCISLLVITGIIFVRTDKFYLNPTLAIFGFKIYKVECGMKCSGENTVIVITKDKLQRGDIINYKTLSERVIYAQRKKTINNQFI